MRMQESRKRQDASDKTYTLDVCASSLICIENLPGRASSRCMLGTNKIRKERDHFSYFVREVLSMHQDGAIHFARFVFTFWNTISTRFWSVCFANVRFTVLSLVARETIRETLFPFLRTYSVPSTPY